MSFRCDWGGERKENKFSTYTNTQCHIHLSHSEFFHRHISCWLLPIMMMMIANQMWKTFPISDNELLLKIKNNTVNLCGPCVCVCVFFRFLHQNLFFFYISLSSLVSFFYHWLYVIVSHFYFWRNMMLLMMILMKACDHRVIKMCIYNLGSFCMKKNEMKSRIFFVVVLLYIDI